MLRFSHRDIRSFPHLSAFLGKEYKFGHHAISKDVRSQFLRVDSGQMPGGEARWSTWRFPQVSDDLDVNRTMNLV